MSIRERKTSLLIGAILALSLVMGFLTMPRAYAEESTQETAESPSVVSNSSDEQAYAYPEYQGKSNLKEYWNAVKNYRTEISDFKEVFQGLELSDELWAPVEALIDSAQKETDLSKLESIKTELAGTLDAWIQEALAVSGEAASTVGYSGQSSSASYYSSVIQSGVLTRAGGVNSFGGRTETWYSQKVLPGGGLNIPGRHVAEDGTIRDADGYIVVAASDLTYGDTVETSLGTGKVYDTGCAPGVTDVYTDW